MLQEDSKDADLDDDDASLRGRNQYESLSLAELEMVRSSWDITNAGRR